MTTTPPRTSLRVRTPPTPLHGPRYDNYEPYSPRRSKRSTAQSNPYSSFNGERSPKASLQFNTTPPTTGKRARFARAAPTQLSSPPSSPISPIKRQALHKPPRKQIHKAATTQSDSDAPNSLTLAPPTIDPVTMLPTPSKTPHKKRLAAAAGVVATVTGRTLNFQPNHPNDVMPASSRKMVIKKKQRQRHHHHYHQHVGTAGFELYDESDTRRARGGGDEGIEIYTDANARVPEWDESEENPFVGRRKGRKKDGVGARPQQQQRRRRRDRKKKAPEEVEVEVESEDRMMKEAVGRDEGVVYVFRGKKIFRRFEEEEDEEEEAGGDDAAPFDLSATPSQHRLKRQAGAAAQRPLTRSAIKPRLLFPSEEQRLERERVGRREDDVDEEAVTDIEMLTNAETSPTEAKGPGDVVTPVEDHFQATTPPPSTNRNRNRATRARGNKRSARDSSPTQLPISGEEDDGELISSAAAADDSSPHPIGGERKTRRSFESWQRTKAGSGAGRKRAGEEVEEGVSGGGKRTRGNGNGVGVGSPD